MRRLTSFNFQTVWFCGEQADGYPCVLSCSCCLSSIKTRFIFSNPHGRKIRDRSATSPSSHGCRMASNHSNCGFIRLTPFVSSPSTRGARDIHRTTYMIVRAHVAGHVRFGVCPAIGKSSPAQSSVPTAYCPLPCITGWNRCPSAPFCMPRVPGPGHLQ